MSHWRFELKIEGYCRYFGEGAPGNNSAVANEKQVRAWNGWIGVSHADTKLEDRRVFFYVINKVGCRLSLCISLSHHCCLTETEERFVVRVLSLMD